MVLNGYGSAMGSLKTSVNMILNGNGSAMGLETSVHMKEFFS